MEPKERVLGVDYADDVERVYESGEMGDAPLIESIMDNAAAAGMTRVCWRVSHLGWLTYRTRSGTVFLGYRALRPSLSVFDLILKRCDPLRVAVEAAHARGLKIDVYYTLFDESYAEGAWVQESDFGRDHPQCWSRHHDGGSCVRGVLSLGYPEVRRYFAALVEEALGYGPDGVYLDCARTHAGANPIPVHGWWPQWTNPYLAYGYNEPDVEAYRARYGSDAPVIGRTDMGELDGRENFENWNRVRGEALTTFLREIRPLFRQSGRSLTVCFYPATYNGFQPGYQVRQMLGRYHIDWRTWADEGLLDTIRLNTDHRKIGYDDWVRDSAATYSYAQERGVRVLSDCCITGCFDKSEDPPAPLPILRAEQPDAYFSLMADRLSKLFRTSADGVFYYEHGGGVPRTWEVLRSVHDGLE